MLVTLAARRQALQKVELSNRAARPSRLLLINPLLAVQPELFFAEPNLVGIVVCFQTANLQGQARFNVEQIADYIEGAHYQDGHPQHDEQSPFAFSPLSQR